MFYLLIGIVIAVSFNDTFRERLAQKLPRGERSGLRTRIAAGSVLWCELMKY